MIKKLNSLTVLFIITVVMVLLMLITIQRPSNTSDDEGLLFPELYGQLNGVDTIKIKSSQDEFTLYKEGEDWFIKERWSFFADFNLVKRALVDLSEAKILERKTDKPEQLAVLSLEGMEQGGESIHINLLQGEEVVAGLVLGRERELGQTGGERQFYVRRAGEERAWLAEGYLNINPLMLNWIKSEVINIARERIAQVNIIQPNGSTATIISLGQKDKFGTPEDRDETVFKYAQLGYDIAGSLFQLKMEDVQPASDFSRGESEIVTAEFLTFDGLKIITETSFDSEDGYYYSTIRAESSVLGDAPKDIQALNVLKTADQVQEEITVLNKQFDSWVYRFGGFVGTNLMRSEADMVTQSGKAIPMPADVTGFGS
ncbi:MAG: DUF4340 domain-containing protein [Gammaproteobacteria bacterium]|nr:DUF4340 domain-containing protein [Gammaproteobacteria bacterium]